MAWIPAYVEHELSSRNRQVSLVVYYIGLPDMDAAGNVFSTQVSDLDFEVEFIA